MNKKVVKKLVGHLGSIIYSLILECAGEKAGKVDDDDDDDDTSSGGSSNDDDDDDDDVTLKVVRAATTKFAKKSAKHKKAAIKILEDKFDVDNIKQLDEDDYEKFLKALKKAEKKLKK